MEKICRDCRYFKPSTETYRNSKCQNWNNFTSPPRVNLVTGETDYGIERHAPHMLRNDGWWYTRMNNTCGIEGRWYEPIFNNYAE
jgi:hypothetical protein